MPGGAISVSSNGADPESAIVWATLPFSLSGRDPNAESQTVSGEVLALSASTLEQLWSSEDVPTRDRLGYLAKFNAPIIANGKVYVASFGDSDNDPGLECGSSYAAQIQKSCGQLVVYGL